MKAGLFLTLGSGTSSARNENLRPLLKRKVPLISGKYGLRNHFWPLENGFRTRKSEKRQPNFLGRHYPILRLTFFLIVLFFLILWDFQNFWVFFFNWRVFLPPSHPWEEKNVVINMSAAVQKRKRRSPAAAARTLQRLPHWQEKRETHRLQSEIPNNTDSKLYYFCGDA